MKNQLKQTLVILVLLAGILPAGAQTFKLLYTFTGGNDGGFPYECRLIQAGDGNLYGTAEEGGTNGFGAIFRITPSGVFTPLYSFTGGNDGANPYGSLLPDGIGNFYGTALGGGTNGSGAIYRITPSGALTPLYTFGANPLHDGRAPGLGLAQAGDGNLYGTTIVGNTNHSGGIFRISPSGTLTVLHSFNRNLEGSAAVARLVLASDGNLYGTAQIGGTNNAGTIFRITIDGVFTPLYSFTGGNDGADPYNGLVQASDGNLYGTASQGGTNGYGTVYRITTNGVFTPIYSFTAPDVNGFNNDGASPYTDLMQASDGCLYGTTIAGGVSGNGTIFRITTCGLLTTLYSFTGGDDGGQPYGSLMQASDGNLYGTSANFGTYGAGTVFELTLPPPNLNILSANQSTLLWPGSNTNYILQSTTDLSSSNWVTVSNITPAIAVTVTVTNVLPAQFFRLASP